MRIERSGPGEVVTDGTGALFWIGVVAMIVVMDVVELLYILLSWPWRFARRHAGGSWNISGQLRPN